jgi:hypothetical protein
VPPIRPANAAAKASDYIEFFMKICLSLVKPRTKAWGVEVHCVVRRRTGKYFKEDGRDSASIEETQ